RGTPPHRHLLQQPGLQPAGARQVRRGRTLREPGRRPLRAHAAVDRLLRTGTRYHHKRTLPRVETGGRPRPQPQAPGRPATPPAEPGPPPKTRPRPAPPSPPPR